MCVVVCSMAEHVNKEAKLPMVTYFVGHSNPPPPPPPPEKKHSLCEVRNFGLQGSTHDNQC